MLQFHRRMLWFRESNQGKGFSNGSGVYLEGDSLFVVKQVPTREGFLVMEVSPGLLLKKVSISKDLSTQTRSSILDKNGRVIVSTDSSLKGKDFKLGSTDEKGDIKLRPLKLENGVLFTTNGKEKIAAIQRVEGTPLYLLIDTTHAVLSAAMLRYLQRLLSLVLVILIVGGVGTFWLVRRFAKPLNNLCYVMDRAAQGDLSARFTPDRMGFEINVVGGVFNQMIDTLLAKMEEVKNERVKKETLERELQLGHDVQRALFPKQLPEFKGLELAADSESAKEVGGDFYDLYPIPDSSKLLITIADVSGKGINACFFSLMARSLLRSFASASCELKSIVQQTNDLFLKDASPSSVFVTAWVGIYDASTMQIAYTNCGHLPALLKKSGQPIEKLTTPGMALGVLPMEDVSIKNFTLSPMDTLVLFTDGVTDAQNPQDEMFGEERLLSLIEEKSGFGAHDLLGVIYQKLRAFSEGAALYDDLTLLILNKCY